jgi:TolB-like protein/lipopolysaccharide biosynthesis regulator YciM
MSEGAKAVFLSYASQDAEAAQRICDALRAAGVEVWFDRDELVGGDAWDAKIRAQIADCALFVPVISANTQARREGYFRLEWKLAAQRTHMMSDDTPFLLPVVIDDTRDADARVPAEFKSVQWTRLPGGETPSALVAHVQRLLGSPEASAPAGRGLPPPPVRSPGAAATARRFTWMGYGWAALGIGVALFYALQPLWTPKRPSAAKPAPAAVVASPDSEARRLVAQARKIFDEGDELDRENLLLAEDLVKRALALDSAEPSAWVLAAQLSYWLVWHSSDPSRERRAEMMRQAARARALAPDSVAAQVVQANARIAMAYESFGSAGNRMDLIDLERELVVLAERAPRDPEVLRSLSQTYRFLQRPDDALRALRQALERSEGDPAVSADLANLLLRRKSYPEAEALVSSALARRRTGRLMLFDLLLKTQWRGDLPAARAALADWPGWLLREDRGAYIAWQVWLWSRQPDRALDAVQRLPRDYLRDVWFTGPRAVLTARAHELAGHREAALTDWRTAVQLADRELASAPGDAPALFWKAWALSRLGDQPGADAAVTLLQQNMGSQTVFFNTTNLATLWSTLGRTDQAFAHLRAWAGTEHDGHAVTRAMLELDPAYEALRPDPRFAALAAAALAPAPAPDPEDRGRKTEAGVSIDQKSVAVLAFANLSEDKANEFFSDGISEELLNVLSKVPGLKVTARTSAFHFKGRDTPIPEIARTLGVAYVVEGSVRRAGDKVRIQAKLIKAADGFQVWGETFTRDLKDVFAVQDEIAGLIAQNLSLKIGKAAAGEALDSEVLPLYYAALQAWNLRNVAGMDRAEELLNRALELAPNFARGHAVLAKVWVIRGELTDTLSPFGLRDSALARKVRAKVDEAMRLDPACAEAYGALGVLCWDTWRPEEAARALRRATELNPNYASAHQWLGRVLSSQGHLDEGIVSLRRAVEVDPLSQRILDNCGRLLLFARRPREALGMAERALVIQPGAIQAQALKAQALFELGETAEAVRIARTLPSDASIVTVQKVVVLAGAGHLDEVEAMLPQLTGGNLLARIGALTALGRKDEALAALAPAWITANRADVLLFEPLLDPLRGEPRFQLMLAELGMTDAHARAQAWRAAHASAKGDRP